MQIFPIARCSPRFAVTITISNLLPYVNGALCWMHGYLFTGKYSSHR